MESKVSLRFQHNILGDVTSGCIRKCCTSVFFFIMGAYHPWGRVTGNSLNTRKGRKSSSPQKLLFLIELILEV